MAYCPECNSEMGMTDTLCSGCGYDFPQEGRHRTIGRPGLAYSSLADLALLIGEIVSGLKAIAFAIGAVVMLFRGELLIAVGATLLSLLAFGLFVVFARVRAMG